MKMKKVLLFAVDTIVYIQNNMTARVTTKKIKNKKKRVTTNAGMWVNAAQDTRSMWGLVLVLRCGHYQCLSS